MFMYGAYKDKDQLELRTSEFKAMMRFWWRALNGNLSSTELYKNECEIFGGGGENGRRSPFKISIKEPLQKDGKESLQKGKYKPTPHHTGDEKCEYLNQNNSCRGRRHYNNDRCAKGEPKPCYEPANNDFLSITFSGHDLSKIESLFVLSCTLGGFGMRSRRGFGSVKIVEINGATFDMPDEADIILDYIRCLNQDYDINSSDTNIIELKKPQPNPYNFDYPFIEKIQIGTEAYTSMDDILVCIGKASHDHNDNTNGSGVPRFASPTYVSILKKNSEYYEYYPIITTLHYAPPPNSNINIPRRQNQQNAVDGFITDILSAYP